MFSLAEPTILRVTSISDDRGTLAVFDEVDLPFDIRRVYFLHDLRSGSTRGSHAHKSLSQIFVAVAGSMTITLDDGAQAPFNVRLSLPSQALYLPPGYWRTLGGFSAGTVCLVLASAPYDPEDYIRDYSEFVAWKTQ